jgi:mannosyltransferase
MRALSVLAMAGAAACVTLAGRRLAGTRAGQRTGLLAGLVFALVPSVSRFAQEIRSYGLEVLVATLATLLLLRAMDQPAVRRWAAYGACVAVLGYLDPVALAAVTGHAAAVAIRWWRDRDDRLVWFVPAVLAGLAAYLPLAMFSWGEEGGQVGWILRPGLDLSVFSFFARNLFYSTSVASAFILLAILAWAVDRWPAAFATTLAIMPVAAVWLVSQGPHAFFFPRYLLSTVGAWAILAGIGLARVDVRAATAVVVALAIFGAGDQQVIRSPGAHNWAYYPAGSGAAYPDYAGAAAIIAREARAGDGIVYPERDLEWLMTGPGVQYYTEQDLRHDAVAPHQLFVAAPGVLLHHLYPIYCTEPAACLGHDPRVWMVVSGDTRNPYADVPPAQAALLRSTYRTAYRRYVPSLTVFLLVRT